MKDPETAAGCLFGGFSLFIILANIAWISFVIWAIYTLVMHVTGG